MLYTYPIKANPIMTLKLKSVCILNLVTLSLLTSICVAQAQTRQRWTLTSEKAERIAKNFLNDVGGPSDQSHHNDSSRNDGHPYYKPCWKFHYDKVDVDVCDSNSYVTFYLNPNVIDSDNDKMESPVSEDRALEIASGVLKSSGLKSDLSEPEIEVDRNQHRINVRWYRMAQGVKFRDQFVVVRLSDVTGGVITFIVNFLTATPRPVNQAYEQDQCEETGQKYIENNLKAAGSWALRKSKQCWITPKKNGSNSYYSPVMIWECRYSNASETYVIPVNVATGGILINWVKHYGRGIDPNAKG